MAIQFFNLVLCWIFFGFLASYLATKRGKNPKLWFWLGLSLGLFSILLLFLIPKNLNPKPQFEQEAPSPLFPPPPEENWHYYDALRVQCGPIPCSELISLFKKELLSLDSFVWTPGQQDWKRLKELPELVQKIEQL